MAATDPDLALRQAAVAHAWLLVELYDDLVPLTQLRAGFVYDGTRASFGSRCPLAVRAAIGARAALDNRQLSGTRGCRESARDDQAGGARRLALASH